MRIILSFLFAVCLLLSLPGAALSAQPKPVERVNILTVSEGAVLLSLPPEYATSWAAYTVFDGIEGYGWCSQPTKTKNNEFLLELSQKYRLNTIAADNRKCQENSYPGISAKTIEVWGSTTSAKEGFSKLGTIKAGKATRSEFPIKGEAQWLKIVIVDNWGDKQYTELMELEAFGTPIAPIKEVSFTGTFDTTYGCMKVIQNAGLINGCYEMHGNNFIFGAVHNRVFHAEWDQGANDRGTALFAMTQDGKTIGGVWYKNGALKGDWTGTRTDDRACTCTLVRDASDKIAQDLAEVGHSVLYGIHFQTDSAVIQPTSEPTLEAVIALMTKQPALKISVDGHTDSTNTSEYNQALSQKRAQAVALWLTQHGVTKDRLVAKGFGETKPIATNDSPQGRALNRRVEISIRK